MHDNHIIYRQIFPNELCTKNKQMDKDNVEPDPDSIRSKAKRARLERAKRRRRQAAKERRQLEQAAKEQQQQAGDEE